MLSGGFWHFLPYGSTYFVRLSVVRQPHINSLFFVFFVYELKRI